MLRVIGCVAAIGVISGTGLAADKEPETLPFTGQWVVNYDQDACHLLAQFGQGDDQVILRFTRYQPGADTFNLALMAKRLRSDAPTAAVKLDFGLSGQPSRYSGMRGNVGERPAVFIRSVRLDGWQGEGKAPVISPEQEERINGLTIAVGTKQPFRLTFKSLGKPMIAMRACLTNLEKGWGYDPDALAHLSRWSSPLTSPQSWFSDNDYPKKALESYHNGFVQFRLDVDVEGKVAGCYILDRTNPDEFADSVCRLLTRRAKLLPALDAEGRPARSYFISSIWFKVAE